MKLIINRLCRRRYKVQIKIKRFLKKPGVKKDKEKETVR